MTRARIELVVGQFPNITLQSTLLERIREVQVGDAQLHEIRGNVLAGVAKDYSISETHLLQYKDQICVLRDMGIRWEILDESHTKPYSLHPCTTKMYQDLQTLYLWPGLKKDVVEYVAKRLTCHQVKAEHQ